MQSQTNDFLHYLHTKGLGTLHYVSSYNYPKSVERLSRARGRKPEVSEALARLSRFALHGIFNNGEIVALFQNRETLEFLRDAMDGEVDLDAHSIRNDLQRSERFFVPEYVMKINTPRYHEIKNCDLLFSNFENFETPPQIQALGAEQIEAFQIFCDKEWPRYRGGEVNIFWAHVGAQFGVSIDPKAISLAAEGAPEFVSGVKEEELADEISKQLIRLKTSAEKDGVSSHLCAPPKLLFNLTKDQRIDQSRRDAYRKILNLKKLIRKMMIDLHRIELQMPEGLMSTEILNALGFLPCKVCCSAGKKI